MDAAACLMLAGRTAGKVVRPWWDPTEVGGWKRGKHFGRVFGLLPFRLRLTAAKTGFLTGELVFRLTHCEPG